MVGIDILSEKVDFKRTAVYQPFGFIDNVFYRTGIFNTSGIGNNAISAEVVAAFLNGQIGTAAGRMVFRQKIKF